MFVYHKAVQFLFRLHTQRDKAVTGTAGAHGEFCSGYTGI